MQTALISQDSPPRTRSARFSPTTRRLVVRYTQVLLLIGLWVGVGFTFQLEPEAYLLLGVPLTAAFQHWVRRRPLCEMWVKDGAAFGLGRLGALVALALLLAPAKELVSMTLRLRWVSAGWSLAALVGALPAAYSLSRFTRTTARQLLSCMATAGTVGALLMAGVAAMRAIALHQAVQPNAGVGLRSLLLYFPVTFVLEEVTFRGVIDAHLHEASAGRGLWSAVVVSALWGLWHWPVAPHAGVSPWVVAVQLVVVHAIIGVPLSLFWRRSGNLAVPAFTHAFIDAVRDALLRA
jgi:membrane protease YdiL (CAAX protease family)